MIVTLNVVMLSAQCLICSAGARKQQSPPLQAGRTWYGSDGYGDESDLDAIKQLNSRLNVILQGSDWLESAGKSKNDRARSNHTARSKLTDGFFSAHHNRASGNRRIKEESGRNSTAVSVTDVFGDLVTTTAATPAVNHPERTVFTAEKECESANGGRPCVCYMTDFLDSACQQFDQAAMEPVDDSTATVFACPSFKAVPSAFVVTPASLDVISATFYVTSAADQALPTTISTISTADHALRVASYGIRHRDNRSAVTPVAWKQIDFNDVIKYQLDKINDEHYAVHYGLVGNDIKIRCLINDDHSGTGNAAFKWDYKKGKNKSNSTITGTDTSHLLILDFDAADSKNYTCTPSKDISSGNLKNASSYKHYVIAVDKPIYEIRGTVVYKTNDDGDCRHEIIHLVKKQLPNYVQIEICPEGSSQYACNVIIETSKCIEDGKSLEVKYLVTLNDKANYLARIKTSKKSRDALSYQKLLARISNVLAGNLNKTLTIQIISNLSSNNMQYEPDSGLIKLAKYVSCPAGFGIREVFCAACPPHHFSPNQMSECQKCYKGFHQPIAGSENCVKCPSIFASGCQMDQTSSLWYYFTAFLFLVICSIAVLSCVFCCNDEYETDIVPNTIQKKLKKVKNYRLLHDETENSEDSSSPKKEHAFKKIKKLLKFKKHQKTQHKETDPEHNITDAEHNITDAEHNITDPDPERNITDLEHNIPNLEHNITNLEHNIITDPEHNITDPEHKKMDPQYDAMKSHHSTTDSQHETKNPQHNKTDSQHDAMIPQKNTTNAIVNFCVMHDKIGQKLTKQ